MICFVIYLYKNERVLENQKKRKQKKTAEKTNGM
jgi:hypothetical protein